MAKFQAEFPDRMFDVGIAEQHAMTMATGLAMGGMRPVVALYSTFLQRAFDQTVHDVCQNDQPVLIAVDRAGLVGEDGTSHQGMFTLSAQRQLPNLVIASPKDEQELRSLLHSALGQDHPFALHYPRDAGFRSRRRWRRRSSRSAGARSCAKAATSCSWASGRSSCAALEAADALEAEGWSIGVINARFARPLDRQLILDQTRGKRMVVTFEESVVTGGFGSGVLELSRRRAWPTRPIARRPCASWASPANGSSTTGRSPTCGASSASTQPGLAGPGPRGARDALRATPGDRAPRSPPADERGCDVRVQAGCATIGG